NRTRVRYTTNTEMGSSGSPCFDAEWGLLALHHSGDTNYKRSAEWNEGVPIDAIVRQVNARLRQRGQPLPWGKQGERAVRLVQAMFRELCDALAAAYDLADLVMMLKLAGRPLEDYASEGTKPQRITMLVGAAQDGGWLDELVRAACDARPDNERLK